MIATSDIVTPRPSSGLFDEQHVQRSTTDVAAQSFFTTLFEVDNDAYVSNFSRHHSWHDTANLAINKSHFANQKTGRAFILL